MVEQIGCFSVLKNNTSRESLSYFKDGVLVVLDWYLVHAWCCRLAGNKVSEGDGSGLFDVNVIVSYLLPGFIHYLVAFEAAQLPDGQQADGRRVHLIHDDLIGLQETHMLLSHSQYPLILCHFDVEYCFLWFLTAAKHWNN